MAHSGFLVNVFTYPYIFCLNMSTHWEDLGFLFCFPFLGSAYMPDWTVPLVLRVLEIGVIVFFLSLLCLCLCNSIFCHPLSPGSLGIP